MPRTDLRELLGDRYDEVIAKAGRILHDDDDVNGERCGLCELHAEPVLAAVLPDLLAAAWDEGHEAGWDDLAARSAEPDLTDTPNPYRAAHAAELHDSTEPKGPTMPNNNTDVPPESWPFPPYVILNLGGESRTYWPRATPDAPRAARAAQGVPASQCGPDAARPADGIVSHTHYGTEGGER